MIYTLEKIKEIVNLLPKGSQKKIANNTGFTHGAVRQMFIGHTKMKHEVIAEALKIIEKNQKLAKNNLKKINKINLI